MGAPFIVLALPRSRTFWLSKFLSYGDWHCGHDELMHMRTLDDCRTWFTQPNIGTVETMAGPFWRLLPPDIRIVTVRRPVAEVLESLMRAVPSLDRRVMLRVLREADRKLDQIEARVPGALSVQFKSLGYWRTCHRLFEHCLSRPLDVRWWTSWAAQRVSGDIEAQLRYCAAYLPQIQRLGRAAKQESLAALNRQHRQRPPRDGFTFQEEPYEQWLIDAQPLFRQHLAVTGQDAEGYALKNLPLGQQLAAGGALTVTTARQNGRMFGYLMAVISPSLDQRDILMAQTMLPYASPECPGLGLRLQRATIENLRAKGVTQVFARAGVRGDGPRMKSLYRRLGFEDDGQLYKLEMAEADAWAQ